MSGKTSDRRADILAMRQASQANVHPLSVTVQVSHYSRVI
jgi:hypothetical protein